MPRRPQGRFLATVMFTDIVGSTEVASKLGDSMWRGLLDAHNALIRKQLKRFGGREMDTAGDGFFATFDQPAAAISCARAITDDVRPLGIEVRVGIHMGEVEVIGHKVGGIAVHIGARVASMAEASDVLVSSTIKDMMAGSDRKFEDRGNQQLKGVEGQWRLYAVQRDPAFGSDHTGSGAALQDGTLSTPAPSAPRRDPGRRGFRGPAVIAGSLVVAAVVIGILALTRRGVVQDVPPTSSPSTELNASEKQLSRLLPEEIKNSCQPVAPRAVGADATLACTSPTDLSDMDGDPDDYNIEYSHFGSRDDMNAAFEQSLNAVSLVPSGDCATAHAARGAYTIGGEATGEVACFQTDQRSYITWTDDRVLVYAVAYRHDLGDQPLYLWWVSAAGPIEAGSALVPKDVGLSGSSGSSNHFPGFPTGTFVKTIKGDLDAGRWKEVVSGEGMQGRYATYVDGRRFERGFWALGKGNEFIIWTPDGPCAGVGFGVYRFHLNQPAPGEILAKFEFISDACGYSGPPDGTSWSHGPPWQRVR